jgi:RNA polymerase sigma-70 factor, ECF subfamily
MTQAVADIIPLPRRGPAAEDPRHAPPPQSEEELIQRWLPTVLRWCRRLGGDRVDAEEAAHDVMLVVIRRYDQVRDPALLAPYIFGVTRRVLAGHRRRAWVRRWAGALGFEPTDGGRSAHARVVADERAALLHRALERLSEDQREVIVLVDLEERPLAEVAELLDVPLGTVKSRLSRARELLAVAARRVGLTAEGEEP